MAVIRKTTPADLTRNEILNRLNTDVSAGAGAPVRTDPQASATAQNSLATGATLGAASIATASISYVLTLARLNQALQISLEDSARREVAIKQAATIQADRAARQAADVIGAANQALASNLIAGGATAEGLRAATGLAAAETIMVARLQAERQAFLEQQLRKRSIEQTRQQRLEAGIAFAGSIFNTVTNVLGPAKGAATALG